jgi:thiamine biosynthesis lipoprotein
MKKIKIPVIILCIALVLGIFFKGYNDWGWKYRISGSSTKTVEIMGTFLTITIYGDRSQELADYLVKTAFEQERMFSLTIPDSELNTLNKTASNAPVEVSRDLFDCIEKSIYWCEKSNGALDISMGNLIDLWGIGSDNEKVPNSAKISQNLGVSYKDIQINAENRTVFFTNSAIKINLGAVAKGYISQNLYNILHKSDIFSGIINLGGNVAIYGKNPENGLFAGKWKVGITDPKEPTSVCKIVELSDRFVITSGDYERYFEENGVKYHHILDKNTGYPANSGLSSVTIIGKYGADCDALSTACFVLGLEKGMELLQSTGYSGIFITSEGEKIQCGNV